MNTRLQVEHPVTEMVWGVDLVKAQILTAQKKALPWSEKNHKPYPRGHSIECRIYAESPYEKNIPSIGEFLDIHIPYGPHRRFELGYEKGDEMTSFYDALILKAIVWDETRKRALQKMIKTLEDIVIFGVKTNIPLLLKILSSETFIDSKNLNVKFLEQTFKGGLDQNKNPSYVLREEIVEKILDFESFTQEKSEKQEQEHKKEVFSNLGLRKKDKKANEKVSLLQQSKQKRQPCFLQKTFEGLWIHFEGETSFHSSLDKQEINQESQDQGLSKISGDIKSFLPGKILDIL